MSLWRKEEIYIEKKKGVQGSKNQLWWLNIKGSFLPAEISYFFLKNLFSVYGRISEIGRET